MHIIIVAVSVLILSIGESWNSLSSLVDQIHFCNGEQPDGVQMVNAFLMVFTMLG